MKIKDIQHTDFKDSKNDKCSETELNVRSVGNVTLTEELRARIPDLKVIETREKSVQSLIGFYNSLGGGLATKNYYGSHRGKGFDSLIDALLSRTVPKTESKLSPDLTDAAKLPSVDLIDVNSSPDLTDAAKLPSVDLIDVNSSPDLTDAAKLPSVDLIDVNSSPDLTDA
ncbi:hypothetical protein L1D61_25405 [Vibrio mediterranei]|nr:hypothetical protein [Vibrio mediterranei]